VDMVSHRVYHAAFRVTDRSVKPTARNERGLGAQSRPRAAFGRGARPNNPTKRHGFPVIRMRSTIYHVTMATTAPPASKSHSFLLRSLWSNPFTMTVSVPTSASPY